MGLTTAQLPVIIARKCGSEVPAAPKREVALCRQMRVTRSSGLAVLVRWAVLIVDISDSKGKGKR